MASSLLNLLYTYISQLKTRLIDFCDIQSMTTGMKFQTPPQVLCLFVSGPDLVIGYDYCPGTAVKTLCRLEKGYTSCFDSCPMR